MGMAAEEMAEDGGRDAGARADLPALPAETAGVAEQGEMGAKDVPRHLRSGVARGAETGRAAAAFEQIADVPKVARQGDEGRDRGVSGGEILGHHEQAVALHMIGVEPRGGAGRVGIVLFDDGVRHVKAGPSGRARA